MNCPRVVSRGPIVQSRGCRRGSRGAGVEIRVSGLICEARPRRPALRLTSLQRANRAAERDGIGYRGGCATREPRAGVVDRPRPSFALAAKRAAVEPMAPAGQPRECATVRPKAEQSTQEEGA